VAFSGKLQLLGRSWWFLQMKIQFHSWKGGGGALAWCSLWRHRLGDLRLGYSGFRLIVYVLGCNSPLLGALGCVELHSVKGLFMSLVFACCTICDRSGVITISTPFLIRS
jgi:hypothetical protein